MCEEKHMGSRAVVIVCRDESVAQRRFGIEGEGKGIVYTRTGRRFFSDDKKEQQLVAAVVEVCGNTGLCDSLETDWICLDCELMPWSAKALELIRGQYAGVGWSGLSRGSRCGPFTSACSPCSPWRASRSIRDYKGLDVEPELGRLRVGRPPPRGIANPTRSRTSAFGPMTDVRDRSFNGSGWLLIFVRPTSRKCRRHLASLPLGRGHRVRRVSCPVVVLAPCKTPRLL